MANITDTKLFADEVHFTLDELSKAVKVDRNTMRKVFIDEPGVLRIGHPASRNKRQYFTLRIPASVARRVFKRMTVA